MVELNLLGATINIPLQSYSFNPHFNVLRDIIQALIPLVLAFIIFTEIIKFKTIFWWVLFLIFIFFLPNAPYTLGDISHLIGSVEYSQEKLHTLLTLLPLYCIYIFCGLESFVVSLMLFDFFLKSKNFKRYTIFMEFTLIFLSALGIVIGRFEGFYSWHLITHPYAIFEAVIFTLTYKITLILLGYIFCILLLIYYFIKYINLTIIKTSTHRSN